MARSSSLAPLRNSARTGTSSSESGFGDIHGHGHRGRAAARHSPEARAPGRRTVAEVVNDGYGASWENRSSVVSSPKSSRGALGATHPQIAARLRGEHRCADCVLMRT